MTPEFFYSVRVTGLPLHRVAGFGASTSPDLRFSKISWSLDLKPGPVGKPDVKYETEDQLAAIATPTTAAGPLLARTHSFAPARWAGLDAIFCFSRWCRGYAGTGLTCRSRSAAFVHPAGVTLKSSRTRHADTRGERDIEVWLSPRSRTDFTHVLDGHLIPVLCQDNPTTIRQTHGIARDQRPARPAEPKANPPPKRTKMCA